MSLRLKLSLAYVALAIMCTVALGGLGLWLQQQTYLTNLRERLSIEAVDPRLESAAGTLGASPLWVFATITLPLALPGIIAGAILAFAKSMGEFGATITFVSNIPGETQTVGDLHPDPGAGRRCRRLAADRRVHRDLDGGPAVQ